MRKAISLLGSTGSIGRQTLDVVRELKIPVAALTANRNIDLLEQQAREFHPRMVALYDMESALEMARRLKDLPIRVSYGMEGLIDAASLDEAGTVVTAVVGMIGLQPTLAAIRRGKRIALANKETLVCAGELVMEEAKHYRAEIVPVDSEHSAIFQCLQGCRDRGEVRRLILTCSGGPFFGKTQTELEQVKRKDALQHPNWKMGAKITIDCATLMNKGLEFLEAMHLYQMPPERIRVVIHRQSIIHSLVEYTDGAMLAQMGTPDMRLPIRYALTYPHRAVSSAAPLDLLSCPPLTFAAPDTKVFPCLAMAMECAKTGGTSGAILNGANEAAVARFLAGEIGFQDIPKLVDRALQIIPVHDHPCLSDILEADQCARRVVKGK